MSTAGASATNVRSLINDTTSASYVVPDVRLYAAMNAGVAWLGAELGFADTWSTGAISTTAGTNEYGLSSTDYQKLTVLRRALDNFIMVKLGITEFEEIRQGSVQMTGMPVYWTSYENTSQATRVRIFPTPDATYSLDAFYQVGAGTADTMSSSDSLSFSRLARRALELYVAADLVIGMHQADKDRLHLTGDWGMYLRKRADEVLVAEKERIFTMRRQAPTRWSQV